MISLCKLVIKSSCWQAGPWRPSGLTWDRELPGSASVGITLDTQGASPGECCILLLGLAECALGWVQQGLLPSPQLLLLLSLPQWTLQSNHSPDTPLPTSQSWNLSFVSGKNSQDPFPRSPIGRPHPSSRLSLHSYTLKGTARRRKAQLCIGLIALGERYNGL